MAYVSQIVACLGVVPAGWGIYQSVEQNRIDEENTSKAMRLAALGHINEMIENDQEAQAQVDKVIEEVRKLPDPETLLQQYGTGSAVYRSIDGLASVGRHYEHLGAMIRLGYVDFDLVFEVITFPDDFWNETEPVVTMIRENWKGPGQPLPDLWKNFRHLRELYYARRAEEAAAAASKSAPEEKQVSMFFRPSKADDSDFYRELVAEAVLFSGP